MSLVLRQGNFTRLLIDPRGQVSQFRTMYSVSFGFLEKQGKPSKSRHDKRRHIRALFIQASNDTSCVPSRIASK